MRGQIVLCVLLLPVFACAPPAAPAPDAHAVRASLEANNAKFMEAFNKGDSAAAAAMYTEDAIAMPPGAAMARGRQAIQDGMASDFKTYAATGLKLTTSDVTLAGDLAVEVGTYSIQLGDSTQEGKYLVVWKSQADGSWKLYRDIWNPDHSPEPAPEPTADGQAQ